VPFPELCRTPALAIFKLEGIRNRVAQVIAMDTGVHGSLRGRRPSPIDWLMLALSTLTVAGIIIAH
jgi:hypothetical protein